MTETTTQPMDPNGMHTASRLAVAATWQDPVTKALYVHGDLVKVQEAWEQEAHIGPMSVTERFGDVESWVAYVERFGGDDVSAAKPFLTWNSRGLRASLDYATPGGVAGRCQWTALHPFEPSAQWRAWMALADGQAVGQRPAIERLEDLAADILEPSPADLANLLRALRAAVSAKADTELRSDGTTSVAFTKDTSVKGGGSVELPPMFTIAIPVLKGHVDGDGRPVLYRLEVRLRVSVDDSAHLALRFTVPMAERTLEDVYADRVREASELLGESLRLLRAAD